MFLKFTRKIAIVLFFLHWVVINSCFAQNVPFQGRINEDNINIRSDSTVASEIICRVNKDERVEVLSQLYGWYRIRLPKQTPVYVRKDMLECTNYSDNPSMSCLNARALKDRINIRLKPDESSPIMGSLDKNEAVNIIKSAGDWYKIEPTQNTFGWISEIFVKEVPIREKKGR